MAKFDSLKNSLSKVADKARDVAKEAGDKLKDVDLKDVAAKTADRVKFTSVSIQDAVKNFDPTKAKESAVSMLKNGSEALKKHYADSKETESKVKQILGKTESKEDMVLVEDALKIVYLLMYADKIISKEEDEKFDSIVEDFGADSITDKLSIVTGCGEIVLNSNGSEYINHIIDGIQEALNHSKINKGGTISKKLLLWNLLAVAYSDGEYSENEKKVLNEVNRLMEIDPSLILEMETAVCTMNALIKQEEELKASNKPYNLIDPILKDIDFRQNTIMQSVHELIED